MCVDCSFEEYLDRINNMLEDGRYDFAMETLEGIQSWVQDNAHIMQSQQRAIDNIEGSVT